MRNTMEDTHIKHSFVVMKSTTAATEDNLCHLAFDNSLQANIIALLDCNEIIIVNSATCKLLGYSKLELLSQKRKAIFDINESSFKKMLNQRTTKGYSTALVTMIKKNGRRIPCEITSAIFKGNDGIENAIITIADMSQSILRQKGIDTKKRKIVARNIVLAKSKQKKIDTKKDKIVADNIILAKSKQKKIDTKNEKKVANNIVLAKSKQNKIDAKKEKIVAENIILAISKQIEIDAKNKKIVAENIVLAISKQVEIDSKNKKIVADNIALAISNQKNIDIKKEKIVADNIVLAILKQKGIDARKEKIVAENIALAKSNQKNIDIRKEKIVADNIILAQAKSDEEKLDNEIASKAEYEKNVKLIFNSSSDILCDDDLVANQVILSNAYEKEFGYKIISNTTSIEDLFSHIHPDDKEALIQDYQRMLASEDTEWKYSFRFLRADHSVANVLSSGIILRNADGKAYRRLGYMQDLNKQKVLEEKLQLEIKLKEKQIAEATEDARETARADIGKELHDNVNQLLGTSKLYLDMAKLGDKNSEMYLSRSSLYTLSAIEEIRKLSKGLATDIIKNLGLCEAIDSLARDTMEVSPIRISCALKSFIEDSVNDKFKLNVYRIVQEQLSNILKHSKATEVSICLSQNKKSIALSVSDNGVGFDTGKKRKGIGIINIKSRAASYNGTADFVSQPGKGCVLTVTFPVTESK